MSAHTFRSREALPPIAKLAGLVVLGLGLIALAVPPADAAPAGAANRFIGAAKCKNCHKAEATGNQFGKWEQMKHSHAFATLATDQAKELGKAKGIADPQTSADCLKCHVTAYGVPAEEIAKGFSVDMGVQCESCHGPGETHMKARVAAAAKGEAATVGVPAGEIIGEPRADTCVKCHNSESPSYKPFCFSKMSAQVAHLNPTRKRTEEELKALMNPNGCTDSVCNCPKPAGSAPAGEGKPADAGEKPTPPKDG